MSEVRIPGNAIDRDGADILAPTVAILRELNVLPTADELNQAGGLAAVVAGPPQSVAVIESSATALSKWWAVGLGGGVAAGWAAVAQFWNDLSVNNLAEQPSSQRIFMVAVALSSAALILAIGYIVGSDVKGRSLATVATLDARKTVAKAIIAASQGREADCPSLAITPLQPRSVRYLTKPGEDEQGWVALAMQSKADGSDRRYLVVKGSQDAWAGASELQFVTD